MDFEVPEVFTEVEIEWPFAVEVSEGAEFREVEEFLREAEREFGALAFKKKGSFKGIKVEIGEKDELFDAYLGYVTARFGALVPLSGYLKTAVEADTLLSEEEIEKAKVLKRVPVVNFRFFKGNEDFEASDPDEYYYEFLSFFERKAKKRFPFVKKVVSHEDYEYGSHAVATFKGKTKMGAKETAALLRRDSPPVLVSERNPWNLVLSALAEEAPDAVFVKIREALKDKEILAFLYLLTGEREFLDRAGRDAVKEALKKTGGIKITLTGLAVAAELLSFTPLELAAGAKEGKKEFLLAVSLKASELFEKAERDINRDKTQRSLK
jgi:hypothetical protein